MRSPALQLCTTIALALFALLLVPRIARAQKWTQVNNPPSGNPSTCLLLTDGTVMCQADENSKSWLKLTPDNTGSYENGKWSSFDDAPQGTDSTNIGGVTCSPCQWAPLYYASAVLPDGRVVFIGGEYNGTVEPWTPIGFLFDPTASPGKQWSAQLTQPFGYGTSGANTVGDIGDSQSIVLQDGTMLIASILDTNIASFDPSTLTFTALSPGGSKVDRNDEEGWNILPDGKVFTVDSGVANSFELYDPVANTWGNSGTTAGVTLADIGGNCNSTELGPAVELPDGNIVQFPGNPSGKFAVYTIATNSWTAVPTAFPNHGGSYNDSVPDGPASLLVNGDALVMASPGCVPVGGGKYSTGTTPSHFYEYSDSTQDLTDVTPTSPGSNGPDSTALTSFEGRMLLLPSGHVLVTHRGDGTDVWTYTPSGGPQSSWAPAITSAPSIIGQGMTYKVSGTQFNGFSQGASYGDDAQMATNFPLVRITNNTSGHVMYARTHNFSSGGVTAMGVEAVGATDIRSADFDVPGNLELGASTMVVVTNGIPSAPVSVNVEQGSALAFTGATPGSGDFNDAITVGATLTSAKNPVQNETVTFILGSGGGTESCSAVTDSTGTATCPITPNEAAGGYTLTATFAGDTTYAGSSTTSAFIIGVEDTALAYTGSTSADYNDAATVQATLTDPTDATPIVGKFVQFALGSGTGTESCSGTTDSSGKVSCQITPNQQAGAYTLTATFASDGFYAGSSASPSFTINKEETTTKFTTSSPTVIANGLSSTFSATLLEDGTKPISGRNLTISIGVQSCTTGLTDSTGTGSCSITLSQVLGPGTVTASFAGDAYYLPSSASESVLVFAFLNSGSMTLGNLSAVTGNPVEFWGSQWSKLNLLSGGTAPSAFKGFAAATSEPPACGGVWNTGTGNSPGPPATVPYYMGVVVSSGVVQSGSTVFSGNVLEIVVVKTNPGYGPMPSEPGTGTVVATYCSE